MNPRVSVQIAAVLEAFPADVADKRAPVGVYPGVFHQVAVRVESFAARRAFERLLRAVDSRMVVQLRAGHELFAAHVANE